MAAEAAELEGINRDPAEIGAAIAGTAAKFDKNNISSRMMLLSEEFWTQVAAAIQGVDYPVPPEPPEPTTSLDELDPVSASLDAPDTLLTCTGTGFTEGSKIIFNGAEVPTAFVSNTELTTTIAPQGQAGPAVVPVFIQTGAEASNQQSFEFTAPA
jgi:hypothetical protein